MGGSLAPPPRRRRSHSPAEDGCPCGARSGGHEMPKINGRETEIVEGGRPRLRYLVSSPPGYKPGGRPWPVLCFLHGWGEHEVGECGGKRSGREIINAMTAGDMHGPLKGG